MLKNMNPSIAVTMLAGCLCFPLGVLAAQGGQVDAVSVPAANASAAAPDIEGDWGGTLGGSLRLVLHVKKSPTGGYSALVESVDQGRAMIPADKLEVTAGRLVLSSAAIRASFDAKWDGAAQAWVGIWVQSSPLPLTFTRADGERFKPKRPQEDAIKAAPLPYSQQDVSFDGGAANVRLAATLSLPPGTGPFPAVVLVAGSGPNTRDEDVYGHKVLLVLADSLARRGIAVLRYDKRGCGTSSGDYRAATMLDFTADALAATAYLRSRAEVDPRHVGLVGHSEGGSIAPAAAVQDAKIGFIVLLAAPGVRGDRILVRQIYLNGKAVGIPDDRGIAIRAVNEELFAAIAQAPTQAEAKTRAEAIIDKAFAENKLTGDPVQAKVGLNRFTGPWMRHILNYDPAPVLRKVKVPVLALNGERDLQISSKEDLGAIRSALQGAPDATVMELPKLNHLFQSAGSGASTEYAMIEETFNPAALKIIGEWVSAHVK